MYRSIDTTFWADKKISEECTPEERYVYLYLLTNNHTRLCGCYEVTVKVIAFETGFSPDKTKKILESLDLERHMIRYCFDSSEVLLLNWAKYQWNTSPKTLEAIRREAATIHCEEFHEALQDLLQRVENKEEKDTLSIPYPYPIDGVSIPRCSVLYCNNNINNTNDLIDNDRVDINNINNKHVDNINKDIITEIVEYLNTAVGSQFKPHSKETVKHIKARLREGYTLEDFKKVIDNKARDWISTDQEKYLRPETLFGSKFEGYLNQHYTKKTELDVLSAIAAGG